jgi:hypothetical protein
MGELLRRRRGLVLASESGPIDVGNALTSQSSTNASVWTPSLPIYMPSNTVVDIYCLFNWKTVAPYASDDVWAQFPLTGSYTVNGNISRGSSDQNLRYNAGTTSSRWSGITRWSDRTVVRLSISQASKHIQAEFSDGTLSAQSVNTAGAVWPERTVGLRLHLKKNSYFKRIVQTTDGIVVHDCVPRKLNGVVGMLDLITDTFVPVTNSDAIITTI